MEKPTAPRRNNRSELPRHLPWLSPLSQICMRRCVSDCVGHNFARTVMAALLLHRRTQPMQESLIEIAGAGARLPASFLYSYHLGIPAANHDPDAVDRMRSTGLVQGFGGAGESVSSMRKSPSTSSGTPVRVELCWTLPSFAQNSVAKTLWLALLPTPLPEPRRRPRPSSRILPSCFTSAARSWITQIWPAAGTVRTVVFVEPVGITPIPPLNLTTCWAMAD